MHFHLAVTAGLLNSAADCLFLRLRKSNRSRHIRHSNLLTLLHLRDVVIENLPKVAVTLLGHNDPQKTCQFLADPSLENRFDYLQLLLLGNAGVQHQRVKAGILGQDLLEDLYLLQQFPDLSLTCFGGNFKQGFTVCFGYYFSHVLSPISFKVSSIS